MKRAIELITWQRENGYTNRGISKPLGTILTIYRGSRLPTVCSNKTPTCQAKKNDFVQNFFKTTIGRGGKMIESGGLGSRSKQVALCAIWVNPNTSVQKNDFLQIINVKYYYRKFIIYEFWIKNIEDFMHIIYTSGDFWHANINEIVGSEVPPLVMCKYLQKAIYCNNVYLTVKGVNIHHFGFIKTLSNKFFPQVVIMLHTDKFYSL